MRGFVTIFWVFIFYQFSMLMFRNWQDGGNIMPWTIARVFFGDIRGFVLIEAVLIAVTYLGFIIQLIVCWAEKRRIKWLLQHPHLLVTQISSRALLDIHANVCNN